MSNIIKTRCENNTLKKLPDSAFHNNLKEDAALNAVVLYFLIAGGNKSIGDVMDIFELNPDIENNYIFISI